MYLGDRQAVAVDRNCADRGEGRGGPGIGKSPNRQSALIVAILGIDKVVGFVDVGGGVGSEEEVG